jgi:hypothetical protein
VYTQLYYEKKWKPILQEQYKEYKCQVPEGEKVKLAFPFAMDWLCEIYDNESEEVKVEVETY